MQDHSNLPNRLIPFALPISSENQGHFIIKISLKENDQLGV